MLNSWTPSSGNGCFGVVNFAVPGTYTLPNSFFTGNAAKWQLIGKVGGCARACVLVWTCLGGCLVPWHSIQSTRAQVDTRRHSFLHRSHTQTPLPFAQVGGVVLQGSNTKRFINVQTNARLTLEGLTFQVLQGG